MKKLLNNMKERMASRKIEELNDDGFSLIELVVAIGVLLVLTVGGLIGYSSITQNAKEAAVETAAAEVYTAAKAYEANGDDPKDAETRYNDSVQDGAIDAEVSFGADNCIAVKATNRDGLSATRGCGATGGSGNENTGGNGDNNGDGDDNGSGNENTGGNNGGDGDDNGSGNEEEETPIITPTRNVSTTLTLNMSKEANVSTGTRFDVIWTLDGKTVCQRDYRWASTTAAGCYFEHDSDNVDLSKLKLRVETEGSAYEKTFSNGCVDTEKGRYCGSNNYSEWEEIDEETGEPMGGTYYENIVRPYDSQHVNTPPLKVSDMTKVS